MNGEPIQLVLCDVDGTLITNDKLLTPRTVDAVGRLGDAGIAFALTSGRPPRGMSMFVEPLALKTPIAAFNGGMLVDSEMQVLEQRTLPGHTVGPIIDVIESNDLDAWVYQGAEWLVRDVAASHVDRESWTVQFSPTVVADFTEVLAGKVGIAKLVGVGDALDQIAHVESEVRDRFGDHVSAARSQPYYLDITHPQANKGSVARYLAAEYRIPPDAIATLGDMPNDVLMFAHSGLSIAMGNASSEVQRAARRVTTSNEQEGFAMAVDRYILPTRTAGSAARGAR